MVIIQMIRLLIILCFVLLSAFASVQAEEPKHSFSENSQKSILKIEDFFPAKQKWTVSTGLNILNSNDKGSTPAYYINQISPGNFTVDRTSLAYKKENNGVSAYSTLMYGLTDTISLSTTLNAQWLSTRYTTDNGKSSSKNKTQFNGIGLGGSYQLYQFSDYTVLYGGINTKNNSVKSYILGSSFNWIYDPLVLSLSLGYLDDVSKEKFSTGYNAYTTSGVITFAINPEVNLNWGVTRDYIIADDIYTKGKETISNTSLTLGTSINLMASLLGSFNVKGGVGGNNNSTLSFNLTYKT